MAHARQVLLWLCPRLIEGRVLLAGDSGHFSLPIGGQGMNTGIQDAFNLGWKLAWVLQGKANAPILDTYSLERQRVKQELCDDQVKNFGTLMHTSPVRKWAMMNLGPLIMRMQKGVELRGRDETQLSINYPASPLTVETRRNGGVKAGDRCPDAVVADRQTGRDIHLFSKIYTEQLTLLIFDNGQAQPTRAYIDNLLPALSRFGQLQIYHVTADERNDPRTYNGLLSDLNRDAHKRYGIKTPTVYLVRPDGYAGFRGGLGSGAALIKYLDTFFWVPSQQHTEPTQSHLL